MANKITYKGKVHYWVNSVSTKIEAEKFAKKRRGQKNSVVIRKIKTPVIDRNGKTLRYYVYQRSIK